ncbi:putative toxin-antitoxin system toxin component, PIN family [Lysobacter korlensis]|uniref:Toxin-antitoxin system toxin component, PIN family n=1 Tax=Lysobacter korlensis TaxID=553636 RepID=A0ABV6RPE7_9GAMM
MVLDTNAWLDLLVFRDPRAARLDQALQSGRVEAVTDDACRAEWQRVLDYPQLALPPDRRQALLVEFDRRSRPLGRRRAPRPLPRCADPDDQKFLELAWACEAHWLVSRDHAVLALARRMQRECGLAIVTPEQWKPR